MPLTATSSAAFAGDSRIALNVVRPAQRRGAASTAESSSGTEISPVDFATITSAYPPSRCTPVNS